MVIIFTLCFILLDIVTGLVKAFMTKTFTSSAMKQGLWSKCGSMLLIVLGVIGEYGMRYIELGITIPLLATFCSYISLMEIGSIIENIGQIDPRIVPSFIKKYFAKITDESEVKENE